MAFQTATQPAGTPAWLACGVASVAQHPPVTPGLREPGFAGLKINDQPAMGSLLAGQALAQRNRKMRSHDGLGKK